MLPAGQTSHDCRGTQRTGIWSRHDTCPGDRHGCVGRQDVADLERLKVPLARHGERRRVGAAIFTAFVEFTVNQVVCKRMVTKQQMRWSPQGAHLFLQVRTRVLGRPTRRRRPPLASHLHPHPTSTAPDRITSPRVSRSPVPTRARSTATNMAYLTSRPGSCATTRQACCAASKPAKSSW